ncbi:MAG: AI-2E family transporter [Pseudomonadota bacterium]
MKDAPLLNLVLAMALVIGGGWLLVIGRPVLLPIMLAVISVYILTSAVDWMRRFPLISALPNGVLRAVVLGLFALVLYAFSVVVASTVEEMTARAPAYQTNLNTLLGQIEESFGLPPQSILDEAVKATVGSIDVRAVVLALLGSATTAGATAFLIVIYSGFLLAEQARFPAKIAAAFPEADRARAMLDTVVDVNRLIGEYLAVKTLVNVILGAACLAIMVALGTDFALFWAIIIGLANYIPYVGSWIGVVFPVVLSIAQTGSLLQTLILAACLTAAQIAVGNVVEPRLIGKQLNLSPFVVIAALAIWSSLWGIPGAVLAVPLTSMLAIILARFPQTRPISLLLADRVMPDTARDPGSAPAG